MTVQKQKRKKKNKGLIIGFVCLSTIVLIVALFTTKSKLDEYTDKTAMEQTLADVLKLYNRFRTAIPEQEEIVYEPENTCDYKSGLWSGYECQVKGSIKYNNQDGDLTKYFKYIDQIIDLNAFSIVKKGMPQNYENQLYQSYEIKDNKTQIVCNIHGSSEKSKARLIFLCRKDSNFQLYPFEEARKDEKLYSE